jgi:methylated-DNA-[protein]-cysteine S-methyltransferase
LKDYTYWERLKYYIIVDYEGKVIKRLDLRTKKPSFERNGSEIIAAVEKHIRTGKSDYSGFIMDLSGMTYFEKEVLSETFKIPAGSTRSYGDIARAIGKPGASRAVGNALGKNPIGVIIPCHRVVAKNSIGGYTGDMNVKLSLLRLEGAI